MKPIRILLQTTIPFVENDWHVGRFSLLARELATGSDGERRVEVTARDRASSSDDPVLSTIDRSDFDEIWIFGVDTGNGLTAAERDALARFRSRGGGLLTARDHQDLGSCLVKRPPPRERKRARASRSAAGRPVPDRKSTRLHSSHDQ